MMIGAIGEILVFSTLNVGVLMFAMCLMEIGVWSPFQMILERIKSSSARPLVKHSVVVAICGMFGNASLIYESYLYPESQGPRYSPAELALAGVCGACEGFGVDIGDSVYTAGREPKNGEGRWVEGGDSGILCRVALLQVFTELNSVLYFDDHHLAHREVYHAAKHWLGVLSGQNTIIRTRSDKACGNPGSRIPGIKNPSFPMT